MQVYAGRFAGSFDLDPDEAVGLEYDDEVTFTVKGRIKQVTKDGTRAGDLRLQFVVDPQEVRVYDPFSVIADAIERGEKELAGGGPSVRLDDVNTGLPPVPPEENYLGEGEPQLGDKSGPWEESLPLEDDDWEDTEPGPVVEDEEAAYVGLGHGHLVSAVSPNSNVAGTSQVERDDALRRFVWEGK